MNTQATLVGNYIKGKTVDVFLQGRFVTLRDEMLRRDREIFLVLTVYEKAIPSLIFKNPVSLLRYRDLCTAHRRGTENFKTDTTHRGR